jgi:hypothetical protein
MRALQHANEVSRLRQCAMEMEGASSKSMADKADDAEDREHHSEGETHKTCGPAGNALYPSRAAPTMRL